MYREKLDAEGGLDCRLCCHFVRRVTGTVRTTTYADEPRSTRGGNDG